LEFEKKLLHKMEEKEEGTLEVEGEVE